MRVRSCAPRSLKQLFFHARRVRRLVIICNPIVRMHLSAILKTRQSLKLGRLTRRYRLYIP